MSLRNEASIASNIWYFKFLVYSHTLVGTKISLIEFQYTLMFLMFSSLLTVFLYKINYILRRYLLWYVPVNVDRHRWLEGPVSLWVVKGDTVDH